jgi:hypothetical protein
MNMKMITYAYIIRFVLTAATQWIYVLVESHAHSVEQKLEPMATTMPITIYAVGVDIEKV